ncbi:uncharacterized protein LOC101454283 [Ceratitis capitata]|uniref:uncharacterized protein LOC101454283 n=1 Tax=Ceratitis capitata TaxID=7213 RepID=UPI000C6C6E6F|nr:uncharacterized protein LOC101454283 [Ceratitis capitata]
MIYCINIVYGATIGIEDLCIVIANLPFSNFGMNSPNRTASDLMKTEMNRELQYSTVEMAAIVASNVPLMNEEQRTIYDRITLAVPAGQGGFFFLVAPGGTGKTIVISQILAEMRSNNGIALAVASSGIAATLLDGGDFRQTLPVIPRSTYADEINAYLKSSQLWRNVEKLQLKISMRVQMLQDPSAETFSKQLLDIGNGKVTIDETGYVHTQYINHEWLAERAILAAKNVDVYHLNLKIQILLAGNLVSYKSNDTVCDDSEAVNSPTEFLNSLDLQGIPPHNLQLKDVPIQLKRIQFPIRLAFAKTINKSQGQPMAVCGLDLRTPCFSHGQLYVACSRVGQP